MMSRCGTRASSPHSHCDGSLAPKSPNRRDRLGSVMPPRNSGENAAMTDAGRPSVSRPLAVNAICSAEEGGGSLTLALVTGAARSHAFAAGTPFTRTSAYVASVRRLYPKRTRPCTSAKSTCTGVIGAPPIRQPSVRSTPPYRIPRGRGRSFPGRSPSGPDRPCTRPASASGGGGGIP